MGSLITREIVQTRTWIDPSNPNPQLPEWDYNFTYPITIFDAVFSDYGPNPYTLRQAIKVLEDDIASRQPMIPAGSPNDVVTWTDTRGKLGRLPVARNFEPVPELRSKDRLPTEEAIGRYVDTKTPLTTFEAHVADVKADQISVHVTDDERTYWNAMTPIGQFLEHRDDKVLHVTAEDRHRWDSKASGEDLTAHLKDYRNPHRVDAAQVNTFTREEILALIEASQPKFFNYKNIAWDMVNGTFSLELYQAKNWDPNYILDHRYNQNYWTNPNGVMPDGTEFTVDQDTLRFLPDLPAGQRYFALVAKLPPNVDARYSEVLIYFKDEMAPWVEVATEVTNNGDLFITYPDRRLYLWVGGQFVELMTTSILTGDQNNGTPDHNTKDDLLASQFRIEAGTERSVYNGETHTVKVGYENDMITTGRAGTITVYYDGNYTPPIRAGKYKISVTTSGGTAFNPVSVPLEIGELEIERKEITCEVTVADKVYDGTDRATYLVTPTPVGIVPGNTVTIEAGDAHFTELDVGENIPVVIEKLTLIGPDADNYSLVEPSGLTANIVRKTLTLENLAATNRSYDRTTTVQLTGGQLVGVVTADTGGVHPVIPSTGTIASPNAGINLPVMIDEISLAGDRSSNYTLIQPENITVTVSVIRVRIIGLSVENKTYDGTTSATVTGEAVISGRLGDDDVTVIDGQAAFVTKNSGDKTAVFSDYSLGGSMAGNYLLIGQPSPVTANIAKRQLTASGVEAINRPYDGTCIVQLTGGQLNNLAPGDTVAMNLDIGLTDTPTAGFAKAIKTDIKLTGNEIDNYILSQPEDITVDIERKHIMITDVRTTDRPYDGTFLVALTGGQLIGVVGADRVDFTLGYGTMDSASVGNAKPVSTAIQLGGPDAANYELDQPVGLTVNIRA